MRVGADVEGSPDRPCHRPDVAQPPLVAAGCAAPTDPSQSVRTKLRSRRAVLGDPRSRRTQPRPVVAVRGNLCGAQCEHDAHCRSLRTDDGRTRRVRRQSNVEPIEAVNDPIVRAHRRDALERWC